MDWITRLPDRLRVSLESLLDSVEQHEETYLDAQNASVGQIWVALAYMNQRVQKLEELVNAQRKALNDLDQEVDIDQHLESNLEESLKRY
jgi:predicted  nucleic acid-binding Zn-ribbon protein